MTENEQHGEDFVSVFYVYKQNTCQYMQNIRLLRHDNLNVKLFAHCATIYQELYRGGYILIRVSSVFIS